VSVKSTDLQNLIPKAAEVGRVQRLQDEQQEVRQQQIASRFTEQLEGLKHRVPESPEARNARVEKEKERQARKEGNSARKRRKDAGASREDGTGEDDRRRTCGEDGKGALLDVRL